ncbi:DUF58 domain-containing protein [Candidatus Woesearchaeota archaeon]|nr:DUF58 domain-containing protein [Candidatus Woesearchaeota archaeon]
MKEFKVDVTPLIKKLEIFSRKGLSGFLSGEYRSIFKGRGLEFHGYRNYNPSEDDAKNIDWKASLRSRYLLVKELVEERNNSIVFLLDVGSTMSFGSTPKLKNEYVIEMFASVAYSLIEGGDSVGLTLFSDGLVTSISPNIGTKQYYTLLKTVTNASFYEGAKNFEKTLHDFNAIMTRPSIIFIISDFIGLSGDWYEKLKILSVKHEVIVFVVRDPRDLFLPAETGQIFVQDPGTRETLLINTKMIKEDYERHMRDQDQQLVKMFKNLQIEYLFMTTTDPFSKIMFSFFKQRALRWASG